MAAFVRYFVWSLVNWIFLYVAIRVLNWLYFGCSLILLYDVVITWRSSCLHWRNVTLYLSHVYRHFIRYMGSCQTWLMRDLSTSSSYCLPYQSHPLPPGGQNNDSTLQKPSPHPPEDQNIDLKKSSKNYIFIYGWSLMPSTVLYRAWGIYSN